MTSERRRKHAYTAMQIYQALQALGHAPVFDPEKRPDGPLKQDRPMLIGTLLAITELALITEPPEAAMDVNNAYARQAVEGRSDNSNLVGMLAVRFDQLQMLVESMGGGQILNAVARNAAATSGLLNLWLLGSIGRDLDTDDVALLRQGFKDALVNLKSARDSFDDVRRQLVKNGLRL